MNQPILQFLAAKNYKNLQLYQSNYLNKLNVFIGSNGSGKSNFISCLEFLKNCLTTIPDESRGVSSFENAVAQMGGNKILAGNLDSPAKVSLAYCFANLSQTSITHKQRGILDLKLYIDRNNPKVSISEEYLYGGADLHESASSSLADIT